MGVNASQAPSQGAQFQERLIASGRLFMENKGQWGSDARFMARTRNLTVWVTDQGLVFDHYRTMETNGQTGSTGHVIRMGFVGGSSSSTAEGISQGRLKADFSTGSKRVQGAETFKEAWVRGVYPGVDVRTYFQGSRPRYDLKVAPGANARNIQIRFDGIENLTIDSKGDLVLPTQIGDLKHTNLVAYQLVGTKKKVVAAKFRRIDKNTVGFTLGQYDATKPLVIDPLVYGSYYGGDDGWDEVRAVTADEDGGVYLTGSTRASLFPALYGPYGFNVQGVDAFVSRLQGDVYAHDYAAFIGGNLADVGQQITLDAFGNIWIAGASQSTNFPGQTRTNVNFLRGAPSAGGGTFFLRYNGARIPPGPNNLPQPTDIPYNATAAQVQTAINAVIGTTGNPNPAVCTGGPLPGSEIRIELPNDFPGVFQTFSTGLTAGYEVVRRPAGQAQLLFADTSATPSAGNFRLQFGGDPNNPQPGVDTTANLPWNASSSQVQQALSALTAVGSGNVQVFIVPPSTGALPTGQFLISFSGPVAGPNPRVVVLDPTTGTEPLNGVYLTSLVDRQEVRLPPGGNRPVPPSFFALGFENRNTGAVGQTAFMNFNATGAVVDAALEAVAAVGTNNVFAFGGPLPDNSVLVNFVGALLGEQELMTISNVMQPRPVYTIYKPFDIWVTKFSPTSDTVLTPFPQTTYIVAGSRELTSNATRDVDLRGFAVVPNATPGDTDPVELVIAGNTATNLTAQNYATPLFTGTPNAGLDGFLLRLSFNRGSNLFSLNTPAAKYMNGSAAPDVSGLALDSQGNAHVTGSVGTEGAAGIDTSLDSTVFQTSAGVYNFGRLLRGLDAYVRKYAPDGTLIYSVLVGGNTSEVANGIAVDIEGNAYITGVTNSFNFPRTRGVYGENFGPNALVYVTKLNRDASQILYSTHLRTVNVFSVKGVAVDTRLNAYVTGETGLVLRFPSPAGDPNEPNAQIPASVPTTSDALRSEITSPEVPELPCNDGYLLVLNSTATDLLYGSYIGGDLNEELFAPFTDKFGDVWVMGRIDTYRFYTRVSSTGAVTSYLPSGPREGGFTDAFLSPFAFRRTLDTNLATATYPYGSLSSPFDAPQTINASVARDGFVLRLRIGLPLIDRIDIVPNRVAGGMGASTTGTVVLTSAAPQGGVEVTLNLSDSTAASFDANSQVGQRVLTIPAGATTAQFSIFTSPVTTPTTVDVRGSLEGSFRVSRFNISPWLVSLSVAPSTVVGGNGATGRVRLFQAAPTGGITVQLIAQNNLVQLPNPSQVTVPAGQDTAVFNFTTRGVARATNVDITASFLGAGSTATVTLTPGNLLGLTFNPARIASGSNSVGTITLDGQTGAQSFDLGVRLRDAAPGYRLFTVGGTPLAAIGSGPLSGYFRLPVPSGATRVQFLVSSPVENVSTQRVFEARRVASLGYTEQTVRGTLFVDAVNLTGLTLSPVSVVGGANVVGRVTLGSPSPTGGTRVNLVSGNPALAVVPSFMTVPAGQTSGTFTIRTNPTANTSRLVIQARRGSATPRNALLEVRNFGISLGVNPASVLGGLQNSVGTVTLTSPAPTGGLRVNLTSSRPSVASVPSSVVIAAGQRSRTFTITSFAVSTNTDTVITAAFGTSATQRATATLSVRTFGINRLQFIPNRIQGGQFVTMRVTLDAAAPSGGAFIALTGDANRNILVLPASVTVAAGRTTQDFRIRTNIVPRDLSTTVTGRYRGKTSAGTVTVLK
jgi:hypothetical protein